MKLGFKINIETDAQVKNVLFAEMSENFPLVNTSSNDYHILDDKFLIDNTDKDSTSVFRILNFNSRESLEKFWITLQSVEHFKNNLLASGTKKVLENDHILIVKHKENLKDNFKEQQKSDAAASWLISTIN